LKGMGDKTSKAGNETFNIKKIPTIRTSTCDPEKKKVRNFGVFEGKSYKKQSN